MPFFRPVFTVTDVAPVLLLKPAQPLVPRLKASTFCSSANTCRLPAPPTYWWNLTMPTTPVLRWSQVQRPLSQLAFTIRPDVPASDGGPWSASLPKVKLENTCGEP